MSPGSTRDVDWTPLTRRALLRAGLVGGAVLAAPGVARSAGLPPVSATYDFNRGWRFGGRLVTLPHTVTRLSWGDWQPRSWQQMWTYRKRFSSAELPPGRVFADFDGVMTNATVYLNGFELAAHLGGFLPFSVELTDALLPDAVNELTVVVDGRLLDVPPFGNAGGAASVDYFTPAGIYRDVTLRVVPSTFISDVFAKPVDVLTHPALDLEIALDSLRSLRDRVALTVELLDGHRTVAVRTVRAKIGRGSNLVKVRLSGLHGIRLWSPGSPHLYTVRVTTASSLVASHTLSITTGFREAVFQPDGFYLNGRRLQITGLGRHQLFPYTGMAAPARLQARDAQLLRRELNGNMVRCAHYPQSPHFLDACDRLGLMVWEEPPGWQYIGDENFKAVFLQNVHDMVVRDRNRPSVVVWAGRLDETANYPTLYEEARRLIYQLDGTRQTTGAMTSQSTTGWAEDVFAYNDYTATGGNATPRPPIPGLPYIISEAVGSLTGPPTYRWVDSSAVLQDQAKLHAQVNQVARGDPGYSGVLAWTGVDYASMVGGSRIWHNLKWNGILDEFRVPKPGAAFYRSQTSPAVAPVILPAFYWDFGPESPATGPGPGSMLFTNCDQLQVYVGGALLATTTPDTTDFGNLAYPPALVDLTVDGTSLPDLIVLGYVNGAHVASLGMSSDPAKDRLVLNLEDETITGDGSDATRLTFRALDAYGNQRPYVSGAVSLSLTGPAVLVGQNPFQFGEYGGVGGVYIRSEAGRIGTVTVTARHPTLGSAKVKLVVTAPTRRYL